MKKFVLFAILVSGAFFMTNCQVGVKNTECMTISVDNKPVFKMILPPKWSSKKWRNKTILIPPAKYPHIQLWCLTKTKNIKDAVSNISELIKSEVLKFKISQNKDIAVAGVMGKHLIGTGLEADDQDPSNADVYIFSANSKVFVLCVHGEGDEAAKQRNAMKQILSTVK